MNELEIEIMVVIVVWNGLEDTVECLQSLRNCRFERKRILVVDNGSTDGSGDALGRLFPEVEVLRLPRNLGFTGGNNLGLLEAMRHRARYAFLLNNDTTVSPDALCRLFEHAQSDPRGGILAPVIHYYDCPDEIWCAGARVKLSRGEAFHEPVQEMSPAAPAFGTEWVSGCAMLVRMAAVVAVGMFDSRFYLTWEDVDWCLRMRSAGYGVWVVPSSRILHKGGRSGRRLSGIYFYYAVRNSLLVAKKHGGTGYWAALAAVAFRYARQALHRETREKGHALYSVGSGLWHHLTGHYGPASGAGCG